MIYCLSYSLYAIGTVLKSYLIIVSLLLVYRVLKTVYFYKILPKLVAPKLYSGDKNGWALVTGCTDGIGKGLAEEFLRNGLRTILISRSADKLKLQSEELAQLYPNVETKFFAFNFTSTDYSGLSEFLNGFRVDILINNVGIGPSIIVKFLQPMDYRHEEIVNVNLLSVFRMTELVLPKMVENKFGRIVNVSSILGRFHYGYAASYGATKSAIIHFTKALSKSQCLAANNVLITCICPHLVATKLSQFKRANLCVTDRHSYAKEVLTILGRLQETTGCFQQDIQIALANLLPNWAFELLLEGIANFWDYRNRQKKQS